VAGDRVLTAMTVFDAALWVFAPKATRDLLRILQLVKEVSLSAAMLKVLDGASTPTTYVLGVVASGLWMLLVMVELIAWSRTVPVVPVAG
jgi:hypothetical protein